MPTTYGWSDDDIERRALTLAALIRRAWRLVARKIAGKKNQPVTYADLGQLPRLWSQQVDSALLGMIGTTVLEGAESVSTLPGFPAGFELGEDLVEHHLQVAQGRLWDVGADVWQSVQAELIAGHKGDETYEQIAARIKHATGVSDKKSLTIARTEIHAALEAGQYYQALMVDPNAKKTWLATEDERTRLSHREADGQVQLIGDSFNVGGSALAFPGDPTGPPEEIVNCRCSVAYDFDFADLPETDPSVAMVAAGKWTPEEASRHPRDKHGKFIPKGGTLFNVLTDKDVFDFLGSLGDLKSADWATLKDDQKHQILDNFAKVPPELKNEYTETFEKAQANISYLSTINPPAPKTATPELPKSPDTLPGLAKAVPGDVYKSQDDGAVVAVTQHGTERLRWDAKSGKYQLQIQKNGDWKTSSIHTKKSAYEILKADKNGKGVWHKPKVSTSQTVQKVQTTGPSEPPQAPNAPSPDTTLGAQLPYTAGSKLVPATIYKPHADGTIVAVDSSGIAALQYDAKTNKYQKVVLNQAGEWSATWGGPPKTKKVAYEEVKSGQWFVPLLKTGVTPETLAPAAPAVVAPIAPKLSGDYEDVPPQALNALTLPKPKTLTLVGKAKTGQSKAKIYLDQDGNRWLVKATGSETLPMLEEAAAKLQRRMGLLGPSAYVMDVDGQHSFVQAMFDGKNAFGKNSFDPTKLTHQEIIDMQREQVLDWLIGNNDSHSGQFLRLPNGRITSIDKGHAFRFYAIDELKPLYAPWSPNDGDRITYPEMWHQYESGGNILMSNPDEGEVAEVIKRTMDIPDDEIRDLFRPYAKQAAQKGYLSKYNNDPEKFLDAIVARKNNLRHDFVNLYETTTKNREAKIAGTKQPAKSITSDDTEPDATPSTPYDQLSPVKKLLLMSQSDWLAQSDQQKQDFIQEMKDGNYDLSVIAEWDPDALKPKPMKIDGEFTADSMYNPSNGWPNWYATEQAMKNGQLLHNIVIARTKDEKLRVRTHSLMQQFVIEQNQDGHWVPLEITKPDELGFVVNDHAPYENWVSIWAPPGFQPDGGSDQLEVSHDTPPGADISGIDGITTNDIIIAFQDDDITLSSLNEKLFLKLQEVKKTATDNNGKPLTDAQILAVLDTTMPNGGEGAGQTYTKKIFNWAQTPYGADFMKNNFWDPSWKTAEPDDTFAAGYPTADSNIDISHLLSGHNDLHWTNLSSAIINAGPNQIIAVNRVDTMNGPVITRMVTRPNFGKPGDPDQHIIAMERLDNATGKWTTIFADNYSYDFHKLEQRVKLLEQIDGSSGWKNATGAKILPGVVSPSTPSPLLPDTPTPPVAKKALPKKVAPSTPKMATTGHVNPTGDELFALKTSILYTNGSTIASATGPDGTKYKLVASGGSIGAKSASPSDPNTWKTDKWIYNANDANTYIGGTGLDWTVQDPPAWTGSTITPSDGSEPIPYVSWHQIKVWAPHAGKTQYNGKTTPIAYTSGGNERIIFNGPGKNFAKQRWNPTDKKWDTIEEANTPATLGKSPSKWHKKYWYPVDAGKVHVPKPGAAPAGPIKAPPKANEPALGDITFLGDPLTATQYDDTSKVKFHGEFKTLGGAHNATPAVNFLAVKTVSQNNGVSMLALIRILDEQAAKNSGKPNTHAYETQIIEWLKTPKGHGYAHGTAKAGLPPTPEFHPESGIDLTKLPSKEESDHYTYDYLLESQTQAWWDEMLAASPNPNITGKSGIRAYTGNVSSSINEFLYGSQTTISPTNYAHMKNAQRAMRPSIKPVLLHRGTGWSQLKMSGPEEARAAIGQVRISEGFNSASVGGSPGMSGPVTLEIEAPPGTPMFWTNTPSDPHAAYPKPISQHPSEREMLLGAGIHYQILSVDTTSSYNTKIRVRVVRDPDLTTDALSMGGGPDVDLITAEDAVTRGKLVEQLLSSHRHLDTSATHATKQSNGEVVWSAERDAIHRQIVDDLYADAAGVPNEGKAIFLGGPIGAGKTTTLKDQAGEKLDDYLMVSPDDIKDVLAARGLIPEIPAHPEISPLERSTLVQAETLRIALMLAQRAAADKKNVIWDTTMGSTGTTRKRLQDLRDQGYSQISAIIVEAPPKVTAERSAARYLQGLNDYAQGTGHGGRYVPQHVLDDQYSGGKSWAQHTLKDLGSLFTSWRVYDNRLDGKPAKLVKSSGNS